MPILSPTSTHQGENRKGHFKRAPLASKLAKLLKSEHKKLYEKPSVLIKFDNKILVSYFVLLILPSVILDTLLNKGKVVENTFESI